MRRGPVDSGWAGSLFDESIAPVAAPWASKPVDTFADAAFRQPKTLDSMADRLGFVICQLNNVNVPTHIDICKACGKKRESPCKYARQSFATYPGDGERFEAPWVCDCRNCGEYQGGTCPLYGCMCEPGCRQDPPCTIERCVGYWPATDKFWKMDEDKVITCLQSESEPTLNFLLALYPQGLIDQLLQKGFIQKMSENPMRYDLGESTEEFVWRINHTPMTLAALNKHCLQGGHPYEPFEKWQLLMRNRKSASVVESAKKAPVALVPVEPAMSVNPETETIVDLAKRLTQIAERDGEKILEKLYGVSVGMTAAAAVDLINASILSADKVAIFLKNEGHAGTRAQRHAAAIKIGREVGNWSAWHREPAPVVSPALQEAEQKASLAVDLERWDPIATTKEWMLSNCGKHHSCRDDCAGRRSGALCPFVISRSFLKDCVRQGDMPADLLDDRAKDDAEAKAAKPPKAKRSKPEPAPADEPTKEPITPTTREKVPWLTLDCGGTCIHWNKDDLECRYHDACCYPETCKYEKWPNCVLCLCDTCVNKENCTTCKHSGASCNTRGVHTVECPAYSKAEGEGWTCSDCLCPKCANNGASCHDCKGPVYCSLHGDKMGGCLDFRAKDGEEQPTVPVEPTKQPKPKKQPKLTRADYDANPLPGSNADICSHCDCETCGLNQAHLNYTDKEWASCPPCGCDQCLGKDELQPTTLCGRKAALTVEVLGNTESQLPMEQQHMVTLQRYVRQFCGECKCLTCGRAYQNCAMDGDEPYHICSICTLEHAHHHKPYPAIIKDCEHWIDKATFPADIYAPGQGPCPETACELRYNGEGGPCLCHSCKHGTPDCDSTCGVPGYPMETGQYACEWYAKKEVATVEVGSVPAAELDVPDLVKVGDLVTRLYTRGYVYDIRKVTRVEKTDAGWQICGDLWDDFRHPKRKKVSKDEPIIRWGVTGWKAEGSKIVPLGQKVAQETFGATYNETYADERLIVLTLEQVEQLVAVEEAEDVNGPTNYTRVWLKPEKAKGHKNEQGYLEDPRTRWPCLGHARFVDTSAAAVAKIPSGRRSEVCEDEPECEQCHCHTCQHQKDCRLDNTLNCCSPCKTSGGAHHHKAVDCEGYVTL